MTVIAYRDGVLAADTQATLGHSQRGASVCKVRKRGTVLAAAAGDARGAIKFLDWFAAGLPAEAAPDMGAEDKDAQGYVFPPGGPILTFTRRGWSYYRAEYDAFGCGCDYAIGAMAHGASAIEAVRAALKHECLAGGEITVLRHERTAHA